MRPDLPETVGKLVQCMLAKQPEDRPQTPTELVGALADLLQTEGLQVPQALPPPPAIPVFQTPQAWRRHLPWALPIAALLVISSWMNSRDRQPTDETFWPEMKTVSNATDDEEAVPEQPAPNPVATTTNQDEPAEVSIPSPAEELSLPVKSDTPIREN